MGIKQILLGVVSVVLLGCSSTKSTVANPALDEMVQQQSFAIKVKAMEPQVTNALAQIGNSGLMRPGNTITRFDVTGEGYFVKVHGEQVEANLPYFGERQMGGGYGSDTGIKFKATSRDLSFEKNEEHNSYVATFSVDNSSESYFFTIDLGNSMGSTVRVRSSHRNRIRYTGTVTEISQDDLVSNP